MQNDCNEFVLKQFSDIQYLSSNIMFHKKKLMLGIVLQHKNPNIIKILNHNNLKLVIIFDQIILQSATPFSNF